MKKLNKIYIGVLSTLLILSACNKQLDLKPYQSVDQGSAILTAQDVQITLVGAYNRAGLPDLYGGGVFLYPDLLATQKYIRWTGTFQDLTHMTNQQMLIDDAAVNSVWYDGYQVINLVNNVLANMSKVGSGDKDRTQGEAEFLRGMTYFDLVRLYGRAWNDGDPTANPGVPIVSTPTKDVTTASYVPRSTVAQVYAQAIADLTDAEAKLPESNTFFANKYAASAILARLYLQKGDYPNAVAEATKAIAGPFSLNPNYADEFPYPGQTHVDNTSEDIFAIQITAQQGINNLNTFYASPGNGGRGEIHILPSFLNSFEAGDTRAGLFQYDDPTDPTSVIRCDKFDNIYGNAHVIRLAELYLIRAEANLRISASSAIGATPLSDVNKIRGRAGIAPLTAVTTLSVLNERIHELAFEGGFFLHDVKRTNNLDTDPLTGKIIATTAGSLSAFSPKLVFPIPQVELNANPKLVQNPTYNSN